MIPQVLRALKELRTGAEQPWEMPKTCPACGQPVERAPGEAATYCVNSECPAQLVRGIEHFVSRGAMDIEGFGIRQAELFTQLGFIASLADIYYLDATKLLDLEGYGEKRVQNLMRAIEESKARGPARLLTAVGIRGVGEKTADSHFIDEKGCAGLCYRGWWGWDESLVIILIIKERRGNVIRFSNNKICVIFY